MEAHLFAVYDTATASFGQIFSQPTEAAARRVFTLARRNPETDIAKSPADYILCWVGIYNLDTGHIEPKNPTHILRATDINME